MSLSTIFFWGKTSGLGAVIKREGQSRAGGKRLMPGQAQRGTAGDEGKANPWENRPGCWDTGASICHLGICTTTGKHWQLQNPVQTAALAAPGPSPPTFLEEGHSGYRFCYFYVSSKGFAPSTHSRPVPQHKQGICKQAPMWEQE